MTSSGSDPRGAGDRQDWPFGPVGDRTTAASGPDPRPASGARPGVGTAPAAPATATSAGRASSTPATPAASTPPGRRRPPVWALVAAAVVLVGVVVAAVLLLGDRGGEAGPAPEAEVVTLPVPTPTVEAIPREGGTAFSQALPSTVLAHALSEVGEHVPFLTSGAIEAYRYVYTDGAAPVVLTAGQWETPEEASGVYAALVQAQTAAAAEAGAADAGDGEEGESATDLQEGPVTTTDGAETGRYTLVPRPDGTGTVTWWNGTAVLQLDGPTEELLDLFTAFPL
ncbi:hypothetical protein [Actinotalea solisilvae]|uniref:hypothetical protein n=1 Tax=Actinotalea solisilvae TaxID=2072922 RepID=UPI0018F1E3F9|nr:hypothetical protein [Actinotalea solisilvae]